jgi:pimeloyl-ACP methyl ester carboxylesterase
VERLPRLRKVTFSGAGHMLRVEQPAAFNAAVLEFLADT